MMERYDLYVTAISLDDHDGHLFIYKGSGTWFRIERFNSPIPHRLARGAGELEAT